MVRERIVPPYGPLGVQTSTPASARWRPPSTTSADRISVVPKRSVPIDCAAMDFLYTLMSTPVVLRVVSAEARVHAFQGAQEALLQLLVGERERRILGLHVLREVHEGAPAEVGAIDQRRHLDDRREGHPRVGDVRHVEPGERSLQQQRRADDALVLEAVQPGVLLAREPRAEP